MFRIQFDSSRSPVNLHHLVMSRDAVVGESVAMTTSSAVGAYEVRPMVSFIVELSGKAPRQFRVAPGEKPVKVGRGPGNDIDFRIPEVSMHHLDLIYVESSDGPMLAVRDVSTNGTCIVTVRGPVQLAKRDSRSRRFS